MWSDTGVKMEEDCRPERGVAIEEGYRFVVSINMQEAQSCPSG